MKGKSRRKINMDRIQTLPFRSRTQWKLEQFKRRQPVNWGVVLKPIGITIGVTAMCFGIALFTDKVVMPQYERLMEEHFTEELIAKKEFELELKKERLEIEKEKLKNEKFIEEQKRHLEKVNDLHNKFKIGDRIKILDPNQVVWEVDHYRMGIADVDTIVDFNDDTLCIIGERSIYNFDALVQKVQSSREYKDLVYLQLQGKLGYINEE